MRVKTGNSLLAACIAVAALGGSAHAQTVDWATCSSSPPACGASQQTCCKETAANLGIGASSNKPIIIAMDRCHQSYANSGKGGAPGTGEPDSSGNAWCVNPNPNTANGMFYAYGLIYRLMQQGVPVWWIVNPTKTASTVAEYENANAQRYTKNMIDMWLLSAGTSVPTSGNLTDCGAGCTPPVTRLDSTTLAAATGSDVPYTKKEFPLMGSAFLIASGDRTAFNTFWGTYGDGSPGAGRNCDSSNDCYNFTAVTMYEVNTGALAKWQDFIGGTTIDGAPIGVKISYKPPRIARVASGGAVSQSWLRSANLDDAATNASCRLGAYVPSNAVYCDVSEANLANGTLVAGSFGWAWLDGGSNLTSCSASVKKLRTFLTTVPGLYAAGNVMVNDTRISEIEACTNQQLLGRQGAAASALSVNNTAINETDAHPFILRYPTNLFAQYGDIPLDFSSSSVSHWTSSTTTGYSTLFTGATTTMKRLVSREHDQVAGSNELCADNNTDGDVKDAGELPHSKDIYPHNTATTCDKDPATAGANGDREDMASYARFLNDTLNGIVFYLPGNQISNHKAELRMVLNSIIATPNGVTAPTPTSTYEVARASPVVPIIEGVDAIVQGSHVVELPISSARTVEVDSEADLFTFPYSRGHMRATVASDGTTVLFDAGCNSVVTGFTCPGGTAGIPSTATTYDGGCSSFPKTSSTANCRTIFTNTASGDLRTSATVFFDKNLSTTGKNLIKTGTNLTDTSLLKLISRVIAGYLNGTEYIPTLGGVDLSTVAVIQTSTVAGVTRPLMAYFGAHDGMLHAVCAEVSTTKGCDKLGRELWAFIPRTELAFLRTNTARIDGAPHVIDAYGDFTGTGSSAWRTLLVFHTSMGDAVDAARVPAIYALDVTNPSSPKVVWEYSTSNVTSLGSYELGVGLTLAVGPVTISGATKYVVYAQTTNLGTAGPGEVVTAIDLVTGVKIWQTGFTYPNPRTSGNDVVVRTGIPGGAVPVDLTGSGKITDLMYTDLYGQLWMVDPATGASRNGTTTPLFKASTDYHAIGAKPAIYQQGTAQYAVFATGGYIDPTNTTWPIECCASDNGTSCNSVPPTPTVCSQYNNSSAIFPLQYSIAVKLASTVTASIVEPSTECDTSSAADPIGGNLADCPTNILFKRALGRDEKAYSQALVVGTDIFFSTDKDNANRFGYGTSASNSGYFYKVSTMGTRTAAPTSVVMGMTSAAAGNESTGARSVYQQGKQGSRIVASTSTTGPGVDATVLGTMFRRLWLRTE